MPVIESISALIHADFYLMRELTPDDEFVSHPSEITLREAWDAKLKEAATNPAQRFVYITWLTEKQLRSRVELRNPWEILDFDRIQKYKEQLGEQMFIGSQFPDPLLKSQIATSGTVTEDTILIGMGEWADQCVAKFGENLRRFVGIKSKNFSIPESLSRHSQEGKRLVEWHNQLRW